MCFFSKHLPELDWTELGRAVKTAGFDGVDLTVRAKGHVLPERAAADLPRAIDAIKAQGVSVPMVTTELTSASDPTAKPLLQAAARSGVRYFKTGYWRYTASGDVRGQVAGAGAALDGLAALARDCGIVLGFHNHTAYIGAALWDIAPAMDQLDPKWAGYYFDPRHAVAEGRRRRMEGRDPPGGAPVEDDVAQGFLLGAHAKGLGDPRLPDGQRRRRLGVDGQDDRRGEVQRADLAAFRVRDSGFDATGTHEEHTGRRGRGPRRGAEVLQVRAALGKRSSPSLRLP